MKKLLTVKTINAKHVDQLPYVQDEEYNWTGKTILGRIAQDGFILVQDNSTQALSKVTPIAFIEWQLELLGVFKRVNGKRVYAPTPHTEASKKAFAARDSLPQIFSEDPSMEASNPNETKIRRIRKLRRMRQPRTKRSKP